ncbi:Uncharacterised protein [uncultured archaeon]|nr:Uncharacterised protein [uncultured archaeon]
MPMNSKHGSPYDRGCVDALYGQGFHPHYFKNGDSEIAEFVEISQMTFDEVEEYRRGYESMEEKTLTY